MDVNFLQQKKKREKSGGEQLRYEHVRNESMLTHTHTHSLISTYFVVTKLPSF